MALDKEVVKSVTDVLFNARVSLSEHYMALGVRMSHEGKPGGLDLINQQVKGWAPAGISFTHVQPRLWLFCQQVTSGLKPFDPVAA